MNVSVSHTDDRNLATSLEIPEDRPPFFRVTLRGKGSKLIDTAEVATRGEARRVAAAMLAAWERETAAAGV